MSGSVTTWIAGIKVGDSAAVDQLWKRYFPRLVSLAYEAAKTQPRRVAEEEDVALSAIHSLCEGARLGKFPDLRDRDNLWALLVVITSRKANKYLEHERRIKRGAGKVRDEASLPYSLDELISNEPSPEFAALCFLTPVQTKFRSQISWSKRDPWFAIFGRVGWVPRDSSCHSSNGSSILTKTK